MTKQVLVIGLGQFGMSLARALAENGCEVLAVDSSEVRVAEIAPHVADAVAMDAMDEASLARLAPERRDVCICAIGDDNREGSIVVTALLKQLGAPRVISRATDALHERILSLVGAHEVVHPERHYGQRMAVRLAWRNVINVMPLGGELVLTEVRAPEAFWGRTLVELELPRRFHTTVAAIRRETDVGVKASVPDPKKPIGRGDILMLVSTEEDVRTLTETV
jgi:trk system potassium uptake protein TrkA